MKTKLLILITISLFFSCKKEINDQPIEKSYRIKQIINDSDEVDYKYIYTYQDEKIVLIDGYTKEGGEVWKNSSKVEITYSGNNVISLYYRLYLDNWEVYYKDEYLIEDHKLLEKASYSYSDGQWTGWQKNVFQFSGERLIASQHFSNLNDVFKISSKTNYNYEGDILKDFKVYRESSNVWEEDYNASFIYLNNKLSSVQHFDKNSSDIWKGEIKFDYSYLGNNISKVLEYDWSEENDNWNSEFDYDYLLTYDGTGNLSEIGSTDGDHYTFEYEEGYGNFSDFLNPANKIYKFPDAFTGLMKE